MTFSSILWVPAKKKKKKSHQLWWQNLVNTSLISQFWKNIGLNFLANALEMFVNLTKSNKFNVIYVSNYLKFNC